MKSKIITSIMLMSVTVPSFASLSGSAVELIGKELVAPALKRSAKNKAGLKTSFKVAKKLDRPATTCKVANCGVDFELVDLNLTGNTAKIYKQINKKFTDVKQINNEIKRLVKKHNYGWYKNTDGAFGVVEPGEEATFLTAMMTGLTGSDAQKALWLGYIEVAKDESGKINMFTEGGSRFWKIEVSELTDTEYFGWANLLTMVSKDADTNNYTKFDKVSFNNYLHAQALKAPTEAERTKLTKAADDVDVADCFFRQQKFSVAI